MAKKKKYAFPPVETFRQLVPHSGGCLATDRIAVDGLKIGYMYREEENADRPEDTGWRFFSGDENQEYIDDLKNTGVYAVNTIANHDPFILPYLDTPAPCAFERNKNNLFKRVKE